MKYIAAIGLEVHVQLATRTKMFCSCGTDYGVPPNTLVCPVCLGYPGTLPAINEEAVRLTVLTGLMLGSAVSEQSVFDRKNYFYPDVPKNYQISQNDRPLCVGGMLEIESDGTRKKIRLTRIHLEEDVGKSMHSKGRSSLDFNRAGHPLMEIVTEPDLASPDEAHSFLAALKQILIYGNVSECNLEEGNMRCDINCSIRPADQKELGVKVEIKNLNTFKGVQQALCFEIERQTELLDHGTAVISETRRWDSDQGATFSMRGKETESDYRYFPDPDLMPVALSQSKIESWRASLPELPRQRRERLQSQYGIPAYDAGVIAADKGIADYFEATAGLSNNSKAISNWIMTEMLRLLSEKGMEIGRVRISPKSLARLVALIDAGAISSTGAKDVFGAMFETGKEPDALVRELDLAQVSDAAAIEELIDSVCAENMKSVADYQAGKKATMQFLVGSVMKASKGKANPRMVQDLLKKKLAQ